MIADRRPQIAITSAIRRSLSQTIAEDRTMFYLKAGFHMIADRRSQIADRNKICDRLRSISIVCDLRSAIIWKPAFRWNMVLSSAIVCDHDRRIADDRTSCFHMIADDRRPYCNLRSAIIWKPAFKNID